MQGATQAPRWGAGGARAALSVTFDNLGEAAEIEQGAWPRRRAAGRHPSVVHVLPRILDTLDDVGLRATFFVEGVNAESYPQALAQIASTGHEIALHAWRHEEWGRLEPEREAELLERGTRALHALGHRPVGFRPPGGRLTPQTPRLLKGRGYRYASPAGDEVSTMGGLTLLPFEWDHVDAYFHFPRAGGFRDRLTGESEPSDPPLPASARWALFHAAIRLGSIRGAGHLRDAMLGAVTDLTSRGGYGSLVFHPFLLGWERTLRAMTDVLEEVARLSRDGALWVAAMDEVAEWVERRPASGG